MKYSYRLKDAQRQDQLEKALPFFHGIFTEVCACQWENELEYIHVEHHDDVRGWAIRFAKKDIVASPAYDPNDWNAYPNVKPPENVQMRVEWQDAEGDLRHSCASFREGRWVDADSKYVRIDHVLRFRPWED